MFKAFKKNDQKEKNENISHAPENEVVEQGFFAKLKNGLSKTRNSIDDKISGVLSVFKKIDDDLLEELEEALILSDIGTTTTLYITDQLKKISKERKITESCEVKSLLKEIIKDILSKSDSSLKLTTNPSVVLVIGVNGVGKTTTIGKLSAKFKKDGKKVIIGAADTFRAAAAEQLKIWADRSGADIIKHNEGADPGAVVFDTISAAKARGSDVIVFDTAGRLHNKKNLMDELNKIFRIISRELPDCSKEVLLVLDATTGQNAAEQARIFSDAANITGIVLTKFDGTAKGGVIIPISHEQNIPIKFVGVGEQIDDLQTFDAQAFADAMFED